MKKVLLTILIVMGAITICLSCPACNTLRGAGQDVEKVGDTIEDAAD